jgi:hypothetical protein
MEVCEHGPLNVVMKKTFIPFTEESEGFIAIGENRGISQTLNTI